MIPEIKNFAKKIFVQHPLMLNVMFGTLFGIFILSPLAMVIEHLTHYQVQSLFADLMDIYLFRNSTWLFLFSIIGGTMGLLFGLFHQRIFQLREQLYQGERLAALGALSAGVAHEINTPLANIALIAENIERDIDDPELSARIQDILNQVNATSAIISSLLEFSKRPKPVLLEVDVNDLILHTLEVLKALGRNEIKIKLDLAKNLPLVKGDHGQLQQVMVNIIKNSYDALPNGGTLEITTRKRKDKNIQLIFKDDGDGISKEIMSKLYNPFFTTKENGLGLGLSICNKIIADHCGRMVVESKKFRGTSFKVILPW